MILLLISNIYVTLSYLMKYIKIETIERNFHLGRIRLICINTVIY